jgi:hypothetical protein
VRTGEYSVEMSSEYRDDIALFDFGLLESFLFPGGDALACGLASPSSGMTLNNSLKTLRTFPDTLCIRPFLQQLFRTIGTL